MHPIVFGPVHSRRFGKSLGIDLSPGVKQCNFDCLYCELAPAKTVDRYRVVVPVENIMKAVKDALAKHDDIDVLTVTANGEPTLYPYLTELMDEIDKIKGDIKTLILSNAATIDDPEVQEALMRFDEVKLSLDCATARCLKKLDRAYDGIDIAHIKSGMRRFRERYEGVLFVEILIVKGINDTLQEIDALNDYLLRLRPDRIDLSTIDRPPAYGVQAVTYGELLDIARRFDPSLPVSIASRKHVDILPESYDEREIVETLAMRPLSADDIEMLFDEASQKRLKALVAKGKIVTTDVNGTVFYKKA